MATVASHRTKRQRRGRKSSTGLRGATRLVEVTVAADPLAALDPGREAQLIKAALLYGHRVTVLSPVTAMLMRASELDQVGLRRQIDVLQRMAPYVTDGADTAELQRGLAVAAVSLGRGSGARTPTDLIVRHTLLEKLDAVTTNLTAIVGRLLEEAGTDELTSAGAHGLLRFESGASANDLELLASCIVAALLGSEGRRLDEGPEARLLDAFVTTLSRHLGKGRGCLLLDESVASLMLPEHDRSWAVWGRLPTFPEATVEELLDFRLRLSAPIESLHRALGFACGSLAGRPDKPPLGKPHETRRHTVQAAIESIAAVVHDDNVLLRASADFPDAGGDSLPDLMLVGPAAASCEPLVRDVASDGSTARAALAVAWQRQLARHEVQQPPFALLYRSRSDGPVANVGSHSQ